MLLNRFINFIFRVQELFIIIIVITVIKRVAIFLRGEEGGNAIIGLFRRLKSGVRGVSFTIGIILFSLWVEDGAWWPWLGELVELFSVTFRLLLHGIYGHWGGGIVEGLEGVVSIWEIVIFGG